MNTNEISRYTRIGEWVFEVKMVRALKVQNYGDPYTSCASMTINGSDLYIDPQMTRDGDDFNRKDFLAFINFAKKWKYNTPVMTKSKMVIVALVKLR